MNKLEHAFRRASENKSTDINIEKLTLATTIEPGSGIAPWAL